MAWAALAAACGAPEEPRRLDAGRLGRVEVFAPRGAREGLVFLFSDAAGWGPELERAAREIAAAGAVVVGVDLPSYLAGLVGTVEDGCHYTVAELEDWSHRLQRDFDFERYRSPILAGVGEGATLAHAALAQSPPATLAGGVGVDEAPALATRVPLCPGAPSRPVDGGFAYAPAESLPGFWREVPADRSPALEQLARAVRGELAAEAAQGDAALADLPLEEVPAASASPRFAVIYSGDGGWRDIDRQIAGELAARGTPCVGVDSLRYFWHEKTPEQVASDLARVIRHYAEQWNAHQVLLVGYSFGAGILPAAVNRLPEELRASVVQVSLLGLDPQAPFEIAVTGWLGGDEGDGQPVLPELLRLDLSRVQCFYGEEEEQTLCRDPALAGAERIRTAGGHHFDGDYAALARRILAGAERRAGARPPR